MTPPKHAPIELELHEDGSLWHGKNRISKHFELNLGDFKKASDDKGKDKKEK